MAGEQCSINLLRAVLIKMCKNIILGYTFPKKWITSLGLSYLRLYVNFVNPFVFTDYKGFDPEWAAAPINDATGGVASRTYQVGMNIKF